MLGYLHPDKGNSKLECLEIVIDDISVSKILSSESFPFEIEGRIVKGSACEPSVKGVINPAYRLIQIRTQDDAIIEYKILKTWIYPNRKKIKIHVTG